MLRGIFQLLIICVSLLFPASLPAIAGMSHTGDPAVVQNTSDSMIVSEMDDAALHEQSDNANDTPHILVDLVVEPVARIWRKSWLLLVIDASDTVSTELPEEPPRHSV